METLANKEYFNVRLKTMVKNALGNFYIEYVPTEEDIKYLKYKQNSEKPISLINSFWYNTPDSVKMPLPFINLWNTIQDKLENWELSINDISALEGHFWRLYLVYRHGVNYNILRIQIDHASDKVIEFWNEQLPILSKQLRPYILVNKYLIMPLNRTINYFRSYND
jgi:hypothetical protein